MGDGVADGSGPVLIATKLRPPAVRDQVVARERLLEPLRAGSGLRLGLVACPAGYGKTTLLAEWREAEAARRPVAWLTLDEGDNDPVVFWSYVIEALRRACPAVSLPTSPQMVGAASVVDMVLPRLVNELDDLGEVALILDDFHRLSGGVARESLAWFVDHAPPTFQLVLSTRTEPDLPLAALRAHGELLELRADDLRFTSEEADAFLNGRLGLGLTPDDVEGSGGEDGGMAGRALPRGAVAAARCRPPRFRAPIWRLEPSRDRFPGDRSAPGARPAGAGADAPHFGSRTAVRPPVRCRARAAGLGRDARRAVADQPVPRPARRRGRVVPLPPPVRAAAAGGARAARAGPGPGAAPPRVLLAS